MAGVWTVGVKAVTVGISRRVITTGVACWIGHTRRDFFEDYILGFFCAAYLGVEFRMATSSACQKHPP